MTAAVKDAASARRQQLAAQLLRGEEVMVTQQGAILPLTDRVSSVGNRLIVFKWQNPEHWLSPITGRLWKGLAWLRSLGSRS